ncbi:WHG domain-containing protein [Streptomyces actuosus]|uniref:WHG domain-containing protein n=1 Tax=Streptomyces actuosus TaxID=1885 RepID=A0ABS2VNG3_STRAS|nr:TetR-like C-terminal domain-containing protein [Streptomyces actuosus]MBN0044664.1 WHG domain-containing protein [Streptomyces actuosus]
MARAGITVDRLVAAAADLADEVGFDKVSLSALARSFGVRDASLYSHVRNLQELRTRIALLAGGEMIDRIAAAVAGRAGKEALTAFAGAYREYALAHPGRYAATQIRIDPVVFADTPAMRRTAEITYGMLRAYGLEEPDLTDAVRLLRSTFHGYCALEAAGGFAAPRDVRRSWDKAVDALHTALTHWPREAGHAPTGKEHESHA